MPIRLRPTTERDLDYVLATERDAHNQRFVGQWSRQQHANACADPDKRHFIVERLDDNQRLGYIVLEDVQSPQRDIQLRRIAISRRNAGYGSTALGMIKAIVFGELGACRVWLDVMDENHAAQKVYRNAGFKEVRRIRGQPDHDPDVTLIVMEVDAKEA